MMEAVRRDGARYRRALAGAIALLVACGGAAQAEVRSNRVTLGIPGAAAGVARASDGTIWVSSDTNAATPTAALSCTDTLWCFNESFVTIAANGSRSTINIPGLHFSSGFIIDGSDNGWAAVQFKAPPGSVPYPNGHLDSAAVLQCGLVSVAKTGNWTTYPINAEVCGSNRSSLTLLSDGNFWLIGAESGSLSNLHLAKILSAGGGYTRIPLSLSALPTGFPAVADDGSGNVWFASSSGKIGRYAKDGTVKEYSIASGRVVTGLRKGADGKIWFSESDSANSTSGADSMGVIATSGTTTGTVTEFAMPGKAVISQLKLGPDNNIWFLDRSDSEAGTGPIKMGRITSDGVVTEAPLPDTATLTAGLGFADAGRAIAQWIVNATDMWFALYPASVLSSWDYNHATVSSYTGTPFPIHPSAIFSSAQTASQSFLRFFNSGSAPAAATVTFYTPAGQKLGQWTSPDIAAGSEQQYWIATIEAGAGLTGTLPQYYSIAVNSGMTGTFQHVLYRPADGTLTNLSTCDIGVSGTMTKIGGIHSSLLSDFPSTIVVNNPTSTEETFSFGIYDARNGNRLGVYRGTVEPLGALNVAVSDMEAYAKITPSAGMYHYAIQLEGSFTGFFQHLVNNTKAGVTTDMTTACTLNPTAATTAATTSVDAGRVLAPITVAAQSYLRIHNTGTATAGVTIKVRDWEIGQPVSQYPLTVAAGAEAQVAVSTMSRDANPFEAGRPYYTLIVQPDQPVEIAHVLYRPSDGTLTNLTTCSAGVIADRSRLIAVHSSLLTGFPSSIVINNPGSVAASTVLTILDARNGNTLGTYTTAAVPANGHIIVTSAAIEASLGLTPSGDMYHYVVKTDSSFKGFMQHLVTNSQAGVITDMTTVCSVGP
jgi:hypothetical protein